MDRLGAMHAFVRVVQTGSFSAVGREGNTTQATISKRVAALEQHLGVKLLNRSSRDISLTQVGVDYYDKCIAILSELDEAESNARSQTATPRGILRVTAPVPFGRLVLAPILPEFLSLYPDIRVDLILNDKFVDLITGGVDIAIRAKKLEDSSLIARPLFDNPMWLVAAPQYLKQKGEPQIPTDLKRHNCIGYSLLETGNIWHFTTQGQDFTTPVKGNFQCDNGDTILEMALLGAGIAQLPIWMVLPHIQNSRLKQLMKTYQVESIPFNAIYPKDRYIPLKVRCFVDYLKAKLDEQSIFQ